MADPTIDPDMRAKPWTFTSTITDPDGLIVTTTVELPYFRATDRTIADAPELAQMAGSNVVKHLRKLFEEVPW